LEYLGVDERIILKWILKKLLGRAWTDLPPDRDKMWTNVTEIINRLGSIQFEKFIEQLRSYEFLKKYFALWS
jgi:hypothetical protein